MNPDQLQIQLSEEERDILRGTQGAVLQKVMETVALFGEALGAERLIDINGAGHFVIPWSIPGIAPPIEMLEELAAAGLRTKHAFTLDPRPPLDFENLNLEPETEAAIQYMLSEQERYDELMVQLGLRDKDAYTCNPYQPEVGNVPDRGAILAWSESACAIFANSVLGARTNRNGAIMDLLLNIAGKTPLAGLLTDEGRRADWVVEIKTEKLPNPQLLGAAIGQKLLYGVAYITGLDRYLNADLDGTTIDYLQEMGAALATYSAVSLYHVENVTPEAVDTGRDILSADYRKYVIDENELDQILDAYPVLWDNPSAKPEKCYIGCPHLSLNQIYWWADAVEKVLKSHGVDRLAVETIMCAAPQVLRKFHSDERIYQRMLAAGVRFSPTCCETIFESGQCTGKAVITNSNKLRAYTSARFFTDEELLQVMASGKVN
ncbi:MAG: aconitase X [Anaerolineales bacterium]